MDQSKDVPFKKISPNPFSKQKLLGIVVIIILIGAGIFLFWKLIFNDENNNEGGQKRFQDYEWNSKEDKNKYAEADWKEITTSRLAGFSAEGEITEKKSSECQSSETNFLRGEGGLCRTGFWLELKKGDVNIKIDSPEKLKEVFSPLDSEAEAISFLVTSTSDLQINYDIPIGQVLVIDDGYLIQLVQKNTYGCGYHVPTGVIFKVSKLGEVESIAYEKVKPSTGPAVCID